MKDVILLQTPLWPGCVPAWVPALLEALPYLRRIELERRDESARTASLVGLGLALAGAARLAMPVDSLRALHFSGAGKPAFEHGPFFSVSHTATRVGCAVCAACDVGLDLEFLLDRSDGLRAPKLRQWTAVEAVLKAGGAGMRAAADVRIDATGHVGHLDERTFVLQCVSFATDVIGHVATPVPVRVIIVEAPLDGIELSAAVERGLGLATQVLQPQGHAGLPLAER